MSLVWSESRTNPGEETHHSPDATTVPNRARDFDITFDDIAQKEVQDDPKGKETAGKAMNVTTF